MGGAQKGPVSPGYPGTTAGLARAPRAQEEVSCGPGTIHSLAAFDPGQRRELRPFPALDEVDRDPMSAEYYKYLFKNWGAHSGELSHRIIADTDGDGILAWDHNHKMWCIAGAETNVRLPLRSVPLLSD